LAFSDAYLPRGQKKRSRTHRTVALFLLKYLFEQKSIDGAIVAAMKEGFWEPSPRVAKNFDDVIASARTKFGISLNLMLIRDAVLEEYLDSICIGLPIVLFCRENYEYLALRKYVEGVLGSADIAAICEIAERKRRKAA